MVGDRIQQTEHCVKQFGFCDNLNTETAKQIAQSLVECMKVDVVQLESEINAGKLQLVRNEN